MTPTLWISLILGIGGISGGLAAIVTRIASRKRIKEKEEGEIKLDEASYKEIANRAAAINSEDRIKTERWWKEQFDALKEEFAEQQKDLRNERKWRRKTTIRLQQHLPWDRMQYDNCPQHGPPPPLLDDSEDEDDEL